MASETRSKRKLEEERQSSLRARRHWGYGGAPATSPAITPSFYLLEDGVSMYLMEDGVSKYLLEA